MMEVTKTIVNSSRYGESKLFNFYFVLSDITDLELKDLSKKLKSRVNNRIFSSMVEDYGIISFSMSCCEILYKKELLEIQNSIKEILSSDVVAITNMKSQNLLKKSLSLIRVELDTTTSEIKTNF